MEFHRETYEQAKTKIDTLYTDESYFPETLAVRRTTNPPYYDEWETVTVEYFNGRRAILEEIFFITECYTFD